MSANRYIFKDEKQFPVLFAGGKRKAGDESGADLVTPDSTSGPAEWGRYHDAVREAARTLDTPEEGDIRHFLNARARQPDKVDAAAFHEAVKRQRMADLVDIIDHHMRRSGSLPRGARMVRVQAPRGYIRRTLRKSNPEELSHIKHRLTSIGHSGEHVDNYLSSHVNPDMWDQATSIEVQASDTEFEGLSFDASDSEDEWETTLDDVIDAVKSIEIKPVINVFVDTKHEGKS